LLVLHSEWNERANNFRTTADKNSLLHLPPTGFAALSRRTGKKPIISAVNGLCLGGGMELITNTDLVVAHPKAQFALPEVRRGVVALAGALPRLVRTVGKQRAMEMALTGRMVSAEEGRVWGFVNRVVEDVVVGAVEMAGEVVAGSPDAVVVSRVGVGMGWEEGGVEEGTRRLSREWLGKLEGGENQKEGLRAFVEKRKPKWVDSKL
jgi:enoyl-CoA hydratase/carnithine racemase